MLLFNRTYSISYGNLKCMDFYCGPIMDSLLPSTFCRCFFLIFLPLTNKKKREHHIDKGKGKSKSVFSLFLSQLSPSQISIKPRIYFSFRHSIFTNIPFNSKKERNEINSKVNDMFSIFWSLLNKLLFVKYFRQQQFSIIHVTIGHTD